MYTGWVNSVDEVAKTNLEKPLLIRVKKGSGDFIKVNFNPQVYIPFNNIHNGMSIYIPLCVLVGGIVTGGEVSQAEGAQS